jgi:hypothetical protein
VVLQRPPRSDPFLDETVIRTIGELNALGFDVRVIQRPLGAASGSSGADRLDPAPLLVFLREGRTLLIEALCPDCTSPIRQVIDLVNHEVSPEVVAVRAVEALRASLIEYRERTASELPDSFTDYQRPQDPVSKPPAEMPRPLATTPRPSQPTTPPATLQDVWQLGAFIGPTFATDLAPVGTSWGWAGSIHMQRGLWGIELHADAPFVARQFERPAGSAAVTSLRLGAALRLRLALSQAFHTGLNAGGGVSYYQVDALAAPGFAAVNAIHTTPYLTARWISTYALSPHIAAALQLTLDAVTDTPVLRISGEEVGRLGLPTLLAALGLEFHGDL